MSPSRLGALTFALAYLASGAIARADETSAEIPARVVLRAPECAEPETLPWGPDFVELLRIELEGEGVEELATVTPDETAPVEHIARIEIVAPDCGADQRIEVVIDDVLTHKRVTRTLDVGDLTPELRPRALSIFVIELLRASWAELALPSAVHATIRVPRAILAAVRARAPETSVDTTTMPPFATGEAAALVLGFPSAATALLGGGAGIVVRLGDLPLVVRIDAIAGGGETIDRLGRIELGMAGGGLGLALASRFGDVVVDVGPRLFVGVGWARGTPASASVGASSGESAIVALSLAASLRVRLVDAVSALVGLEVGAPVVGLEATVDGTSVAGVSGAMLGVRIGLSLD